MSISLLTSKGQTTIPKRIRNHLRLNAGDKLDFVIETGGRVFLEPATLDAKDLEGILHKKGMKKVSDSRIKEAINKRFKRI
ncbi:MAG: AbrB family transcriptional regulator [Nitrospirae bacterium]|nr:MAG: AbrB family transcriptional regulator [Nitrospirota bacterium]